MLFMGFARYAIQQIIVSLYGIRLLRHQLYNRALDHGESCAVVVVYHVTIVGNGQEIWTHDLGTLGSNYAEPLTSRELLSLSKR